MTELKFTLAEVVEAVNKHGLVDDHQENKVYAKDEISGFVLLANGKIAQVVKARMQCLNLVYIDNDGRAHLSKCSIAGNIYGDLNENSVKKYNTEEICQFNQDNKIVDYVIL